MQISTLCQYHLFLHEPKEQAEFSSIYSYFLMCRMPATPIKKTVKTKLVYQLKSCSKVLYYQTVGDVLNPANPLVINGFSRLHWQRAFALSLNCLSASTINHLHYKEPTTNRPEQNLVSSGLSPHKGNSISMHHTHCRFGSKAAMES